MGGNRNQYLRDHCVTTYFIVPPARRRKVFNLFNVNKIRINNKFRRNNLTNLCYVIVYNNNNYYYLLLLFYI